MREILNAMKLIASVVICQLAGVIGSIFTSPAISGWYAELQKPFFTPPNWVFAPVWIALFTLMGIALYLLWDKCPCKISTCTALRFFRLQLFLNVVWSVVFFGLHSPIGGLITIILLWIAIFFTIRYFWKADRLAGWLLVPYIGWVTVAAALNAAIVLLNYF